MAHIQFDQCYVDGFDLYFPLDVTIGILEFYCIFVCLFVILTVVITCSPIAPYFLLVYIYIFIFVVYMLNIRICIVRFC